MAASMFAVQARKVITVTPPHQPTYNVRLANDKINAVLSLVWPGSLITSIRQLNSADSYNNRIYFIETQVRSPETDRVGTFNTLSLVLKVTGNWLPGNYWTRKVQNEIGALLLMKKHCAQVPLPEVIAWSEDGKTIHTVDDRIIDTANGHVEASSNHSWVLMSRLPGRMITQEDLNGPHGASLLKEIGQHLASLRAAIPPSSSMGNMRRLRDLEGLETQTTQLAKFDLLPSRTSKTSHKFTANGLILLHEYSNEPIATPLEYYTCVAKDSFQHLCHDPLLQGLRARVKPQLETLIANLPRMSFLQFRPTETKFAHMDFAPRNVLISSPEPGTASTSRPYITGILDGEFAAFLPFEEEFLNMVVRQPDDWTKEQYRVIMEELVKRGVEVPHFLGQFEEPICTKKSLGKCSCDSKIFEGLCVLASILDNIAPWYIRDGAHSEEELEKHIDLAAGAIHEGIEKLYAFLI